MAKNSEEQKLDPDINLHSDLDPYLQAAVAPIELAHPIRQIPRSNTHPLKSLIDPLDIRGSPPKLADPYDDRKISWSDTEPSYSLPNAT